MSDQDLPDRLRNLWKFLGGLDLDDSVLIAGAEEIERLRAENERLTRERDALIDLHIDNSVDLWDALIPDKFGSLGWSWQQDFESKAEAVAFFRKAAGLDPEPGPAHDVVREFTPTEPGYYWAVWKHHPAEDLFLEIVEVVEGEEVGERFLVSHNDQVWILSDWRFYGGPLSRPKLPEPGPAVRYDDTDTFAETEGRDAT